MKFGEKLRKMRVAKGLTQKEMANALGISQRAYVSYENDNVRPRKQEGYDKLAEVLECDKNYLLMDDSSEKGALTATSLAGIVMGGSAILLSSLVGAGVAGAAATASAVTASMAIRSKGKKKDNTEIEKMTLNYDGVLQFEKRQKKYRATALGIIITSLAEKGIHCRIGEKNLLHEKTAMPDEYLKIENQYIENWWLTFWAKDEKLDESVIVFPEERAHILFSRFATAETDPKRKISIVVDDEGLYDELCELRDHNSIKGNISAILLGSDSVQIEKEEFISFFDENKTGGVFKFD